MLRRCPSTNRCALSEITARTLHDYDQHAESFWAGTRDHDVTQNYAALLDALGGLAPLRLLDFGCGPGRDLMALTALGHVVTGLDGSPVFAEMARAQSGCRVLQQNFLELELGRASVRRRVRQRLAVPRAARRAAARARRAVSGARARRRLVLLQSSFLRARLGRLQGRALRQLSDRRELARADRRCGLRRRASLLAAVRQTRRASNRGSRSWRVGRRVSFERRNWARLVR